MRSLALPFAPFRSHKNRVHAIPRALQVPPPLAPSFLIHLRLRLLTQHPHYIRERDRRRDASENRKAASRRPLVARAACACRSGQGGSVSRDRGAAGGLRFEVWGLGFDGALMSVERRGRGCGRMRSRDILSSILQFANRARDLYTWPIVRWAQPCRESKHTHKKDSIRPAPIQFDEMRRGNRSIGGVRIKE